MVHVVDLPEPMLPSRLTSNGGADTDSVILIELGGMFYCCIGSNLFKPKSIFSAIQL